MIKRLVLLSLFSISTILNANTLENSSVKEDTIETTTEVTPIEETTPENNNILEVQMSQKIKNILGEKDFSTHINLINYIISKNLNYEDTLEELKKNKLIKLKINAQEHLDLTFVLNSSSLLSLKNIKDSLKSLGYYDYLTKELDIKANTTIWNLSLKSEAAIDPLILSKTLKQRDSFIEDIIKEGDNSWIYYINSENSKLYNTQNLIDNDQLLLKKPLKPYLIEIKEDTYSLNIYSKGGNRWYPKVIFYDNKLNILQTIHKDKFHRYLKIYIPYNTKYIKIDDLYSLSNINRGMKITKE